MFNLCAPARTESRAPQGRRRARGGPRGSEQRSHGGGALRVAAPRSQEPSNRGGLWQPKRGISGAPYSYAPPPLRCTHTAEGPDPPGTVLLSCLASVPTTVLQKGGGEGIREGERGERAVPLPLRQKENPSSSGQMYKALILEIWKVKN
ncbi:hypothetical protein GN956_G3500 [Arapaima gigas]